MYSCEEIEDIMLEIQAKITVANRNEELDELLIQWGIREKSSGFDTYDTEQNGKILVIGNSMPKERDLLGIAKDLGLDKDRFEFCLDYDAAKTYHYEKLRYNTKYRVVLCGAIPHSTKGKHKSGSTIAELQNKQGYPKTIVLSANESVKITKSDFRRTLENLCKEEYI